LIIQADSDSKGGINKAIIFTLQDRSSNIIKQIHFLLCESCLWCASCLSLNNISIAKCPVCSNKLEWMQMQISPRHDTNKHCT
jgi:hypothetical protein